MYDLLNKPIRFAEGVLDAEAGFEPGMIGRIISVFLEYQGKIPEETVYGMVIDFTHWEKYNKQFASANYYDAKGKPGLYWWEHWTYPSNCRESIYECDPPRYFEVISEEEAEKHASKILAPAVLQNGTLLLDEVLSFRVDDKCLVINDQVSIPTSYLNDIAVIVSHVQQHGKLDGLLE